MAWMRPSSCLASAAVLTACASSSGTIWGHVATDPAPRAYLGTVMHVVSPAVPLLQQATSISPAGHFRLEDLPAGRVVLCVRAHNHRSVIDTVIVPRGKSVERTYHLMRDTSNTDPYRWCDLDLPFVYVEPSDSAPPPVDANTALAILDGLMEGLSRKYISEPAATAIWFPDSGPPARRAWLARAPTPQHMFRACVRAEKEECPFEGWTTFLSVRSAPVWLRPDTVDVGINEDLLRPASGQHEAELFGSQMHVFVLVRAQGRWQLIGRQGRPRELLVVY